MTQRSVFFSLTLNRGRVTGYTAGPLQASDVPDTSRTPVLERLWERLDANADPADALVEDAPYVVLAYFTNHDANTWKPAANARYVVPAGKRLVLVQVLCAAGMRSADVNGRLFDVTASAAVWTDDQEGGTYVPWSGAPPALAEVPAGHECRLEVWNADAVERASGLAVVGRVVDA